MGARLLRYCLLWAFLLIVASSSYAGQILLIRGLHPHSGEEEQIRTLADVYGLEVQVVDVTSSAASARALQIMKRPETLGVLASEEALDSLDRTLTIDALTREANKNIPMLVFGIGPNEGGVKRWSFGAIQKCSPLPNNPPPTILHIEKVESVSRELSGMNLPAVGSPVCRMQLEISPKIETILSSRGRSVVAPVLVRTRAAAANLFFMTRMEQFDQSWIGDPKGLSKEFSSGAGFILFVAFAAGDYEWHLDGHYANLTIDDAWLTQPYGHLDYPSLLTEMQKHNFHTTIAFIPWNFDRSELNVVDLFRSHPEQFSICIHGDDHDHREFGSYAINSLRDQTARIKQSIARMERFHGLTRIPYDRFMVFPHGVAPQETFAVLNKYGFLGTANSLNVPLGINFPVDPTFVLRPYTTAYAGFLSLSRYPANGEAPRLEIAINSFLGNPLLFYGHEDLFQTSISAFDGFADIVQQVQPDIQWTSLGEIARHSHLIRRREGRAYDVRMLSSEMDLRNPTENDALFYVRKEGDPAAIEGLTIDGDPATFEGGQNVLTLRLSIPAHQVRRLRITYRNDLDLKHLDISRRSAYVYVLRKTSDFRDLWLSKSAWGSAITQMYYRHDWNSIELRLEQNWWPVLICVVLVVGGIEYHRRRARVRASR